jgi:hypothetical protein
VPHPLRSSQRVRVFPHCRERAQTATRKSRQGRNNVAHRGSGGTQFAWSTKPRKGDTGVAQFGSTSCFGGWHGLSRGACLVGAGFPTIVGKCSVHEIGLRQPTKHAFIEREQLNAQSFGWFTNLPGRGETLLPIELLLRDFTSCIAQGPHRKVPRATCAVLHSWIFRRSRWKSWNSSILRPRQISGNQRATPAPAHRLAANRWT